MKVRTQETLDTILEQFSSSRTVRRLATKRLKKVKMSKMKRYITILEDVVLREIDGSPAKNKDTNQPIVETHAKFIRDRTIDAAFVSDTPRDPQSVHWSMPMIVAGETIRMAVRNLKPGDVLELEEEDWELLKRATEKGSYGLGAASCVHYMRAINGATIEDPRKTKKDSDET